MNTLAQHLLFEASHTVNNKTHIHVHRGMVNKSVRDQKCAAARITTFPPPPTFYPRWNPACTITTWTAFKNAQYRAPQFLQNLPGLPDTLPLVFFSFFTVFLTFAPTFANGDCTEWWELDVGSPWKLGSSVEGEDDEILSSDSFVFDFRFFFLSFFNTFFSTCVKFFNLEKVIF